MKYFLILITLLFIWSFFIEPNLLVVKNYTFKELGDKKIVFLSEKTKGEALQMSAEAFRRKSKIVKKKSQRPMMALIIGVNPATNALVPQGFIYLYHH